VTANSASQNDRNYLILLILSFVFALGALITLLPSRAAPWPNLIGYKSVCSFAPGATVACGLLAGITCVIRARLFGPRRGQKRGWAVPIGVALALLAVLAWSIPSYLSWKVDAVSAASALPSQPVMTVGPAQ
jgi:hypothetical protein